MRFSRRLLLLIFALVILVFAIFQFTKESDGRLPQENLFQDQAKIQLDVLSQVGPWPIASRLIGYRGKLWFANSVKGRNHNSADIWSYNPKSGETRYERHLYSQDAGHPLVYGDLLYWPFEDALQSAGNGIVEVTDGKTWKPLVIPNPPIYHTSQLLEWDNGLLAITGTRNAGMQLSKDAGRTWQEFYIHPTPSTHVSRLKEMLVFAGKTYAALNDAKVKRLVRWTGAGFRTVGGWPLNRYFNGLTVHQDWLFGIVGRGKEREIWRFDGRRSIRIGFKGPFVDLTSDGEQIWLVANDGRLWSSEDGNTWQRHGDLQDGRPTSIQAVAGGIYAAGEGDDGRGIVWGSRDHIIPMGDAPPALVSQQPSEKMALDWEAVAQEIDGLLAEPSTYTAAQPGRLRALIREASANGAPPGFFRERLNTKIPDIRISAFGGNLELRAEDYAHALILGGMEQSGHPDVPLGFLSDRWTSPPNSYEKYFEIELSALRAIAASGQNDRATIMALLKRLDFKDDPPWLKSQIVGTLTSVSKKHFGYDIAAWQKWAQSQ